MNTDLAAVTDVRPICLDELVTVLAEFPTDHRWNGWLCPNLDAWSVVKVAEALVRAYADADQRGPEITFVDGDLVVTEWDGDESYVETIAPDASGFYSLGAYSWTWSIDYTAEAAYAAYADLVLAIGDGFHPDTRGADYTGLPDGYTAEEVDRIVETFVDTDHRDPSAVANALLDAARDEGSDVWADLRSIVDGVAGASLDHHGLIHVPAHGDDRYVLVDRDVMFRVGLYERDRELALVMVETPTIGDTIATARVLTNHWVEVVR